MISVTFMVDVTMDLPELHLNLEQLLSSLPKQDMVTLIKQCVTNLIITIINIIVTH